MTENPRRLASSKQEESLGFVSNRQKVARLIAAALSVAPLAASAGEPSSFDPAEYHQHRHTAYVNANIVNGNAVLAYDIQADGSLNALSGSPFLTGGRGFFDPSFALGPFDVDQEMAVDRNVLYAVNAGSNDISALRIAEDGSLSPLHGQPFSSGGSTPVSLGVHDRYLVALNSAQDPAQADDGSLPGLTASAIQLDGGLRLLKTSASPLTADAQPSQVLTTDTGPFVFNAEFPGGGHLNAFFQEPNGKLVQTDSVLLPMEANNVQPLPLGLWTNPRAPYVYVGFVNTNEIGVYTVTKAGKLQFVRKVPNSGVAVCWLRVSDDGRFLYTSNTTDNSMSVYDLSAPASPVEIQHISVGGTGGVEQFSLTQDGHFLYLLQEENSSASAGKGNRLYAFQVDGDSGKLRLLSDLTTELQLPPNTRPFGVTVR
jgi:6-phosphogluconolactonase (cycloisomerase 2 family)